MPFTELRENTGEQDWRRVLVLDTSSLKCLLDKQVEMPGRQLHKLPSKNNSFPSCVELTIFFTELLKSGFKAQVSDNG